MSRCKKILNFFDLKGGVIMGIYSLSMIALSFYSVVNGKPIDSSIPAMYLGAIGAFAVNKTAKVIKGAAEEGNVAD